MIGIAYDCLWNLAVEAVAEFLDRRHIAFHGLVDQRIGYLAKRAYIAIRLCDRHAQGIAEWLVTLLSPRIGHLLN